MTLTEKQVEKLRFVAQVLEIMHSVNESDPSLTAVMAEVANTLQDIILDVLEGADQQQ